MSEIMAEIRLGQVKSDEYPVFQELTNGWMNDRADLFIYSFNTYTLLIQVS